MLEQSEFNSMISNSTLEIPKPELNILLKYYKIDDDKGMLTLRTSVKADADKNRITGILEKIGYYQYKYPSMYSKYYYGKLTKELKTTSKI